MMKPQHAGGTMAPTSHLGWPTASLDKKPVSCNNGGVARGVKFRCATATAVLFVLVAATACSDGGGERTSKAPATTASPRCAPPNEREVAAAVLDFVRSAKPTPQRFLIAAGTDSALPDAGLSALQSKGPTYLYPRDAAQQAKLKEKLASIGSYNTLLVTLRDQQRLSATRSVVRLGGTYVGGAADGRMAAPRSIFFACQGTAWKVLTAEQERSS